ncbi:transposase [Glaesserella parasuis]|nr:transposase [Glaesserella parasuis]
MNKPQRKIIRLQKYDYSQNGFYFITVCINNKLCLLGDIYENKTILNDAGKMIEYWYKEIEKHFNYVYCLDYVIMPNHIHFILNIENSENDKSPSLFSIIQWFKTMTTNHYIRNVKENNWAYFNKRLWQRSYYEHIIRNEKSYIEICEYIQNNPLNWQLDKLFSTK